MIDIDLNYYNEASKISTKIMKKLEKKLNELNDDDTDTSIDILELSNYGNSLILEYTNSIHKKLNDKGIASPVSICLNNCVSNYIYDHNNLNNIYNKIHKGDIVKIDFSINLDGYIVSLCETFLTDKTNENLNDALNFINDLPKEMGEFLITGETNDELKMFIESKCTENNVFPVENCISYEQNIRGHSQTEDSKYIMLNYKKYYNENDDLLEENLCFEFEENEVYTINLNIIIENDEINDIKYIENDISHLYRFNDLYYQLKLKSSREFLNDIKSKHLNYKFCINEYNSNIKYRMGIRECYDNNILDSYPIIFLKTKNGEKVNVISKKFTVIIKNNKCYFLKY